MKRIFLPLCIAIFFLACGGVGRFHENWVHDAWAQNEDVSSVSEDAGADDIGTESAEEDAPVMPLPSQEETFEPAKRHVVTSVTKCLDMLPKGDAAAIRATSVTPYQDCQKRLQSLKQETDKEAKRQKKRANAPETYRNFKRVTETDSDDNDAVASDDSEAPAALKTKSVKKKQKTER